ncbi:SDR family oxidoreductase [Methylovulum psychrotolerans]|uniref:NAD-dependent dehydratase n=1 Tax=Methylovulum psychrotolerans TaxID=1704499 RepID=A0A1Z4C386_9GAMM|nr:SDR family oxidoreductase [Methylovulum psychrotolerans]ASF47993.1 NAD-dependent dehydratase [Methylovulum psychrotolerans]
MKIFLTGASGFIGHALLLALVRQGHEITAGCRHPERLLGLSAQVKPLSIDFAAMHSPEQWLAHLHGIEVIINCVGIIAESPSQRFAQVHSHAPIALFTAGVQAGVAKIIQISALGADGQAQSAYHLSKRAADEALRQLPVVGLVLQPSLVYGGRAQSMALLQALAALPVHLLPDGGKQLLQPIHVDDVAAAVCQCLNPAVNASATLHLVGPTPISYAVLLQGLRQRLGKPAALAWAVPLRYLSTAASLGKFFGEPILSKDSIAMLSRGNSADATDITALLGRPPIGIAQQLWQKPASQAERWHTQLYLIKPLLRVVIALVWLWSGITSLWFYPHPLSYELLAATGVTGNAAPLLLYGLAFLDMTLGVATLCRYRPVALLTGQLMMVAFYTVVISVALPEFWFHPFGPLLKNLPFLMTLYIYRQLEGEGA